MSASNRQLFAGREMTALALALLSFLTIYVIEFVHDGGRSYVSPDGQAYLALASHRPAAPPYSHRILQPYLAAAIARVGGIAPIAAFRILAPLELFASLAMLWWLLRRHNSSIGWRVALIIAFGSSLAVSFGPRPVLVDPLILLLSCSMLLALDHQRFRLALLFACLATLTKEYGAILGLAWAGYTFCVGRKRFALLGAFVPGIVLLLVNGLSPSTNIVSPVVPINAPFSYWAELKFAIGYEWRLRMRQPGLSLVILYTWCWAALWPALCLAVPAAVRSLRRRDADAISCAVMMVCSPLLLGSDWDRSLIIIVPFACIVATRRALAAERGFAGLLVIGGVSAAAARLCLFTNHAVPHGLIRTLLVLSLIASVWIGLRLVRHERY